LIRPRLAGFEVTGDTLGCLDTDSRDNSRYNGAATLVAVVSVAAAPGNCYGNPLYSFHPQFLEKPPFFNGLLSMAPQG
jgi:hypothetical protein